MGNSHENLSVLQMQKVKQFCSLLYVSAVPVYVFVYVTAFDESQFLQTSTTVIDRIFAIT